MHRDGVRQNVSFANEYALWPAEKRGFESVRAAWMTVATAAMLTMLSSSAWAEDAQVYKSTDAQGNVVYSDKPGNLKASKTSVEVHEPSADDLARLEQQRQARQAADSQRLQQTLLDSADQAQHQKEKQARCQNARAHFYALKDAARIYQRDAQGNRVYLPDEAADAKRVEARKAMDAACGT
jgi:hypothetical protein